MIQENYDVRHVLAVERTTFANERTFLAYIRTSLTLIITGLSFLGFSNTLFLTIIAWFFIPLGVVILCIGAFLYNKRQKRIRIDKESVLLSLNRKN